MTGASPRTADPVQETAGSAGGHPPDQNLGRLALMVGSIGVVYGDIGTSPLYAWRSRPRSATDP
jgi:KUP system potassium uptake protein